MTVQKKYSALLPRGKNSCHPGPEKRVIYASFDDHRLRYQHGGVEASGQEELRIHAGDIG